MKGFLLIAVLCIGSALAQERPEILTRVPECTERELSWLWPNFDDASRFYQCGAIGWVLSMPCAPGTWFSFENQVCVHIHEWVSPQPPTEAPPPTPEATPEQTPPTRPPTRPPRPSGKPPGKPWWPLPPRPTPETPETPQPGPPTAPATDPAPEPSPPTAAPTVPTAAPTDPPATCECPVLRL